MDGWMGMVDGWMVAQHQDGMWLCGWLGLTGGLMSCLALVGAHVPLCPLYEKRKSEWWFEIRLWLGGVMRVRGNTALEEACVLVQVLGHAHCLSVLVAAVVGACIVLWRLSGFCGTVTAPRVGRHTERRWACVGCAAWLGDAEVPEKSLEMLCARTARFPCQRVLGLLTTLYPNIWARVGQAACPP